MKVSVGARIALRYLTAKKSHSAVNAISIVSVCGMAVATAAIICVLSVFNGFREVMVSKLDSLSPDILITPARGKTLASPDSVIKAVGAVKGVALASPAVVDNALVISGTREMPVTLRGVVPADYRKVSLIDSILLQGGRFLKPDERGEPSYDEWGLEIECPVESVVSIGVAMQLGNVMPGDTLLLFAPRREGRVNPANPAASFVTGEGIVSGVFQSQQSDFDENNVVCDISTARRLFQYEGEEATEISVKCADDADVPGVAAKVAETLGDKYIVRDRLRQHENHFRMVAIEKWVSFLLLFFILVIASFNIISTLTMLVIDKQKALSTLAALGMSRGNIGSVFWWESVYVSIIGGAGGIALGVVLCLLQEKYGLLKLGADPSQLIVNAYPVSLEWGDVGLTLIPIALIGLATASISSSFAKTRISR